MKKSILILLSVIVLIPRICMSQNINIPDKKIGTEYSYKYKNDTLSQIMTITFLSEEIISFSYIIVNKNHNSHYCIQGKASLIKGDAETDEREDGTSYLVDLFECQKECYLAIRIDAETYSRISIVAGDCDSDNLLNSVGYLSICETSQRY